MLAVAVAEAGRRTGCALSGRRRVRRAATAAVPAAFSVSRRRSNAAWSAWPSTGCDEPAPKPSYDEAVHSPAEAPAALPFHSGGPPRLDPGAVVPPTTAATEDTYEGT